MRFHRIKRHEGNLCLQKYFQWEHWLLFFLLVGNHLSNLPVENLNMFEDCAWQTLGEIFALVRHHGLRAGSQRAESLKASFWLMLLTGWWGGQSFWLVEGTHTVSKLSQHSWHLVIWMVHLIWGRISWKTNLNPEKMCLSLFLFLTEGIQSTDKLLSNIQDTIQFSLFVTFQQVLPSAT